MSTSLEAAPTRPPAAPVAAAPARGGKTWLFNPWFDLVLVCFAVWPIIVLLRFLQLNSGWENFKLQSSPLSMTFWQVYFLTTPHRWITLALVFGDKDKFAERPRMFTGLALGAIGVCLVFLLGPTVLALFPQSQGAAGEVNWLALLVSLDFLIAVDYIWNAWHFAAQHSGIHRIYGRMSRPDVTRWAMFEKVVFRVFALYVLFRIALVAALPAETLTQFRVANEDALKNDWLPWLRNLDLLLLVACPLLLLVREFWDWRPSVRGRLIYLVSALAVYGGALALIHVYEGTPETDAAGRQFWGNLTLSFVLAIAMFHATEYLAIVTWAVRRKRNLNGPLAQVVPTWGKALLIYMAALGVGGLIVDAGFAGLWVFMNLVVSFLHYGYDGMIWKQPRPKPQPAAA